jgi:hypothetical protein
MIFGRCLRQRLVVIVGLLAQLASEKLDAELLRCALSRLSADIRSQNAVAALSSGNTSFTICSRLVVSSIC